MKIAKDELETFFGMLFWETDLPGIKGNLKEFYDDFIVEEILPDGTILSVENPELKPSGYEGLFTHFVLVKKGIGNYEAIWILAKKLRVPVGWFSYYGNKDRDALTVQCVSVWNVDPSRLLSIELPKNIKIYSPIRELRGVNVGAHKGNNFKIIIRKVNNIRQAIEYLNLSKRGIFVPNFFGYQRFGVTKPVSHITGKLLLKKRYEDALITYLIFPSIYDDERLLGVKDLIKEGKFEEALGLLPKRGFLFEKVLLRELSRTRDFQRVIKRLPKYLVNMFIESYQSYLFNLVLSKYRIEGGRYTRNNKILSIPLIGYNTRDFLIDDDLKEIIKDVINEEGIRFSDFKNSEIPSLNVKGSFREVAIRFKLKNSYVDEEKSKIFIEFSLGKGQYATVFLREFLKSNVLFGLYSKLVDKMGKEEFESKLKKIFREGKKLLDDI